MSGRADDTPMPVVFSAAEWPRRYFGEAGTLSAWRQALGADPLLDAARLHTALTSWRDRLGNLRVCPQGLFEVALRPDAGPSTELHVYPILPETAQRLLAPAIDSKDLPSEQATRHTIEFELSLDPS